MASPPGWANDTKDTPLVALAPIGASTSEETSSSSPSPQPNDRLQPPQPEIPTPSVSQSQVPTLVGSVVLPPLSEQEAPAVPPTPAAAPQESDAPKAVVSLDEPPAPGDEASASTPSQAASKPESTPPTIPQTPQIYLTFLLLSGHRRTLNFDPQTGVGRVKEVVWGGWTGGDWPVEDRPPAPSYLRVLHAGRMLQDDETLSNLKLPIYTPPAASASPQDAQHPPPTTIMHISVRPFGNGMEEMDVSGGTWKATGRGRRGRSQVLNTVSADGGPVEEPRAVCCGCIIC